MRLWRRLSIFARIAIGNALIIVFGAVGGTLITRHLAGIAPDSWLILLFAAIGVLVSVLLNLWIVRTALQPLHLLRQVADRLRSGEVRQGDIQRYLAEQGDPAIGTLAATLQFLIAQLEASNRQMRAVTERAITAQEDERKRIARSLHDDTGQALSMLIINLERLEKRLPPGQAELAERLISTRQLASQTLDNLRKIIAGLRPSILDDLGLAPAIRWYARTHLEEAGIQPVIEIPEDFPDLPPRLITALFHITQEAVSNVIRHSQARKALIALRSTGKEVYLRIEDDGHGFDAAPSQEDAIRRQHWGLVGIAERVELLSGEFHMNTTPGHGTLLEVIIPIAPTREAANE